MWKALAWLASLDERLVDVFPIFSLFRPQDTGDTRNQLVPLVGAVTHSSVGTFWSEKKECLGHLHD